MNDPSPTRTSPPEQDVLPPEELPGQSLNGEDVFLDPFNDDPLGRYGTKRKESPFAAPSPAPDKKKERRLLVVLIILGAMLGYPFYPVLTYTMRNFLTFLMISDFLYYGFMLLCLAVPVVVVIKLLHYNLVISKGKAGTLKIKPMLLYLPFEVLALWSLGVENKIACITLMALAGGCIIIACFIKNKPAKKLLLSLMILLLSLTAANNIHMKMIETTHPFEAEYLILTPHPYGISTESCRFVTTDCNLDDYIFGDVYLSDPETFQRAFCEHESDNNTLRVVSTMEAEKDTEHILARQVEDALSRSAIKYDDAFFEKYDLDIKSYVLEYPVTYFRIGSIVENNMSTTYNTDYRFADDEEAREHPYSEVILCLIRTKKPDLS